MVSENNPSFLRRCLVLSVLFHVLLILFFADFLASTASNQPKSLGDRPIQLMLHQHETHASPPVVTPPISPQILSVPPSQTKDPRKVHDKVVSPDRLSDVPSALDPSSVSQLPSVSSESAVSRGANETREVSSPSPPEPLSADDLRQYRLSLGREARRYKRYPIVARERGIEGLAVVVVSTRAGMVMPQVSLSMSSGAPALDAQALEMVRLAVRDARIPDSLRNRDFGIDLPIQFSLDD